MICTCIESKKSPVIEKPSEPARAQLVSTESPKPGEQEPIPKEVPIEAQQSTELEKMREELTDKTAELEKLREELTDKTAELEKLREEVTEFDKMKEELSNRTAELEQTSEELTNRVKERKVLQLKFTDFERDMESFEEIITSKQQQPTTEEAEMKGKFAELKEKMRNVQELLSEEEGDEPGKPSRLQISSDDVVRAYDDSLRASKKREQELKERLDTTERDSQGKDQNYSKLANDLFEMQKMMATEKDKYKQQQELLEKLQEKEVLSKLSVDEGVQVDNLTDVIHEYKAMLVASEEEKQELEQAMESVKKMGYARDARILALENEGQLKQIQNLELQKKSAQKAATMEHLSRAKDYHITLLEKKLAAKVKDKSKLIMTSSELEGSATGISDEETKFHATLPDVEVLAETKFLFRGDKSAMVYTWEGYGLKLHVPAGSSASFRAQIVYSTKFELPEGTKSVSPFYWVTSKGELTGRVGVEIQHCAEGMDCSGLRFAAYKVEKQKTTAHVFKEYASAQFSSVHVSSYGRIDVNFSSWMFQIRRMLNSDNAPVFLAQLYYCKQQMETNIVILPNAVMSQTLLDQRFSNGYVAGPSIPVTFMKEKITYKLDGVTKRDGDYKKDKWTITTDTSMQVYEKELIEMQRSFSCMLKLEWCGEEEPKKLKQKIILAGSKGTKFLVLFWPPLSVHSRSFESSTSLPSPSPLTSSAMPSPPTASPSGSQPSPSSSLTSSSSSLSQSTSGSQPSPSTSIPPVSVDRKLDISALLCFKYQDEHKVGQRIFIIDDISSKWRKLGIMLKFTPADLDSINSSSQGDVESCCERMLSKWLAGHVVGSSITWKTLIEALRDARLGQIADDLEKRL